MLKGQGSVQFEDRWPILRPTVLKLLRQESVSKTEWHDLFYGVHLICLWVDKGGTKIYDCLQEDIKSYIKHAELNIMGQRGEQALLNAYIIEGRKFFTQTNYLPSPFRQLELHRPIAAHNHHQSSCNASGATASGTSSSVNSVSASVAANSVNCNNNNNNNSSSISQKNGRTGETVVRELMLNLWNVVSAIFRRRQALKREVEPFFPQILIFFGPFHRHFYRVSSKISRNHCKSPL